MKLVPIYTILRAVKQLQKNGHLQQLIVIKSDARVKNAILIEFIF